MQTVGRFCAQSERAYAPSETCCALLAWLSARHQNGAFLLQSEDVLTRCMSAQLPRISLWTICAGSVSATGTAVPYRSGEHRFMKIRRILRERTALSVLLLPGAAARRECAIFRTAACCMPEPAAISHLRRSRRKQTITPTTRDRARRDHLVHRRRVPGAYSETWREVRCFIIRRSDGVSRPTSSP